MRLDSTYNKIVLSNMDLADFLIISCSNGISFRFVVKGYSMSPFIKNNDVITSVPYTEKLPRYGDVASFINPKSGKLYVHRIIGINKTTKSYLFKGDNNYFVDGFIPLNYIKGRIKYSIKFFKINIQCNHSFNVFIALISRIGVLFHILKLLRRLLWIKHVQALLH